MAITASQLRPLLDQARALVQQLEGLVAQAKQEEEPTTTTQYPATRLTRRA